MSKDDLPKTLMCLGVELEFYESDSWQRYHARTGSPVCPSVGKSGNGWVGVLVFSDLSEATFGDGDTPEAARDALELKVWRNFAARKHLLSWCSGLQEKFEDDEWRVVEKERDDG